MKGTEKQVRWAEDIKATVLAKLNFGDMLARCKAQKPEQLPLVEEFINRSTKYLDSQQDAQWWIETAHLTPDARQLIAHIHAEIVAQHPR